MFLIDEATFDGYGYSTVTDGKHVDYSGSLYNDGGDNLTVEVYVKLQGIVKPKLLSWEEFDDLTTKINTEKYLHNPVTITAEEFHEALGVLPPENWRRDSGFEHFRMCEYLTHTITAQYGRHGDSYICKNIDVCDRSTWIKLGDFA